MPGEIKRLIDSIVAKRSQGNPALVATTKTKLVLKGIRVDDFTPSSPDDPAIISKIRQVADEMGIKV